MLYTFIISCFVFPLVPPVIEPFNFPGDGLVEGTRTRVVCGVSHGDPPLSIAWLKDGAPVLLQDEGEDMSAAAAAATAGNGVSSGGDGAVVVTTLDPYSSLLSIPRLTRYHTGRYTCQAQNPAAQVRYTAALLVKGKCSSGPPMTPEVLPPLEQHMTIKLYTHTHNKHSLTHTLTHSYAHTHTHADRPLLAVGLSPW